MSTFLTDKIFWIDSAERAIKTGAQAILLAIGSSELFNLFTLDVSVIGGYFLGGAFLSIITSLATGSKERGASLVIEKTN